LFCQYTTIDYPYYIFKYFTWRQYATYWVYSFYACFVLRQHWMLLLREHLRVHSRFCWRDLWCNLFSYLCCAIMCFYVPISVLWSPLRCLVPLYLQLFVRAHMSYLRYFCLFAHSGVQHILCYVFGLFFLRPVYPMLPVSLDCQFLIVSSVFSNVYLYYFICCSILDTINVIPSQHAFDLCPYCCLHSVEGADVIV